ncbi:MAG: ribbon-helix-helix domain-containing protein [Candidatus Bathyarchaeota archaeon]|nr:ribbon-helix-helix domain-containing protein [Candidatus Bathyarchaeota archaeon]
MVKGEVTEVVLQNIPDELLEEFDDKVVEKHFPGGRSEAFRYLMAAAIVDEKNGRFA